MGEGMKAKRCAWCGEYLYPYRGKLICRICGSQDKRFGGSDGD